MKTSTTSKVRARLGLADTPIPWWPDGTSTGRAAHVRRNHDQSWTYVCSVLAGLLSVGCLYLTLLALRAWEDYQSVLVQVVTGKTGTIFGLLTLAFLGSAVVFGYTAWWLWTDKGRWHA
jgi:hypothetical protein